MFNYESDDKKTHHEEAVRHVVAETRAKVGHGEDNEERIGEQGKLEHRLDYVGFIVFFGALGALGDAVVRRVGQAPQRQPQSHVLLALVQRFPT